MKAVGGVGVAAKTGAGGKPGDGAAGPPNSAPALLSLAPPAAAAAALARALGRLGQAVLRGVGELGDMVLFFLRTLWAAAHPPYRLGAFLTQAEFVGFGSLFIIVLTGAFTGAVFALQTVDALQRVGMESMVGSTVLMAVTRELGPVLTSLMVTGRVGSAMATELGNMRVSEQIDAIEVMAVDPLNYLVAPRILAGAAMVPCLCAIFDVVAALGAYLVAIVAMHIDEGAYNARIAYYLAPADVTHGILKAFVFGVVLTLIGCYKGFHATGGAQGAGRATTQAVVLGCLATFVLDYIMTAIMLGAKTT